MQHSYMRLILFIVCIFGLHTSQQAIASHIVGGEINYRHLGNNDYEIKMSIYFDCINGNPQAINLDSIVSVGFFDQNNNLVNSLLVNWKNPVFLTGLNYNCISNPPNLCVLWYSYTDTINLPPISGGYQIAFQRCCRNNTILNIVDPANTGATFTADIPDPSVGFNSNPIFNQLPPVGLCSGVPFSFDHSAVDLDGDSLVYDLYTPYEGADPVQNRPQPPNNPPFAVVSWQGNYNQGNMLGTTPPMTINPQTGLLTVTPSTLGQFVVGIRVREFRNGQQIGETRRDYQFNVVNCTFDVVSVFTAPVYNCSYTINFQNNSQGATYYLWDFGDAQTNADTSSQQQPNYTYPGPGTYDITLIAGDLNCTDTFETQVTILPDFYLFAELDTTICLGDTITLGEPSDGGFPSQYVWTPDLYLNNDTIQNPMSVPLADIEYIVTKTVGNCQQSDTVTIAVRPPPLVNFAYAFAPNCDGYDVQFVANTNPPQTVTWIIGADTIPFTNPYTQFFEFNDSTGITVIISDDGCKKAEDSTLVVPPPFNTVKNPIPNVFTPNGDGLNDCFDISIDLPNLPPCYELYIYNRWGRLLFFTNNDTCWTGTTDTGAEATDGVYYYVVKTDQFERAGFIQLIR